MKKIQRLLGIDEIIKRQNRTNKLVEEVISLLKIHINNSSTTGKKRTV